MKRYFIVRTDDYRHPLEKEVSPEELEWRRSQGSLWDCLPVPIRWCLAIGMILYFGGGAVAFVVGMSRIQ